jgi:hypothetical protein
MRRDIVEAITPAKLEDCLMATRSQRSKLALKDFGNPAAFIANLGPEAMAANKGKAVMGYLVGRAVDFVERTMPKTEEHFEGLKGDFVVMPIDPNMEEMESGVLFIPDAFHNLIASRLRDALKVDPGAALEFTFEISAIVAKNPAGYSWNFQPAVEFTGKHPLEQQLKVAKQLLDSRQKAIAGPARK